MRQKNLDLLLILLIAAASVAWVYLPNRSSVVGILCALPLIFVIPGYSIIEALFVYSSDAAAGLIRKPELRILQPFNGSDRLVLSIGLSLAMVIITGFVLNMLPIGLAQTSWAESLALLATVFSGIALYRRQKGKVHAASTVAGAPRLRISPYEYMLFLLAVAITASAVWYSVVGAQQQQQQQTFTQFWMVPSKQAHNSCAVLIGIQSFEAASTTYNVVVTANGTKVSSWPAVALAPQSQWYQSVVIQAGNEHTVYVEAKLYRADKPDVVYRNVHITLNSTQGSDGLVLVC